MTSVTSLRSAIHGGIDEEKEVLWQSPIGVCCAKSQ